MAKNPKPEPTPDDRREAVQRRWTGQPVTSLTRTTKGIASQAGVAKPRGSVPRTFTLPRVRCEPELAEDFTRYLADHDIPSVAEGVRHLIRRGLDADTPENP